MDRHIPEGLRGVAVIRVGGATETELSLLQLYKYYTLIEMYRVPLMSAHKHLFNV